LWLEARCSETDPDCFHRRGKRTDQQKHIQEQILIMRGLAEKPMSFVQARIRLRQQQPDLFEEDERPALRVKKRIL
jgi:hypothetical protein